MNEELENKWREDFLVVLKKVNGIPSSCMNPDRNGSGFHDLAINDDWKIYLAGRQTAQLENDQLKAKNWYSLMFSTYNIPI